MDYTEITQVIGYAKHDDYQSCWVFGLTSNNRYVASNYYPEGDEYHNEKHVASLAELNRLIKWFVSKKWQYASLSTVQDDYWRAPLRSSEVNFERNYRSAWSEVMSMLPKHLIPANPCLLAKYPTLPPHWKGKDHPPLQVPAMPPHWKGKHHAPIHTCACKRFWIIMYQKGEYKIILNKAHKAGLLTNSTKPANDVIFPLADYYLKKPSQIDKLLKQHGWHLISKEDYPVFTENGQPTVTFQPEITDNWQELLLTYCKIPSTWEGIFLLEDKWAIDYQKQLRLALNEARDYALLQKTR